MKRVRLDRTFRALEASSHPLRLALLVTLALGSSAALAVEDPEQALAVRVETVILRPVEDFRDLVGTVRARATATVAAQLIGTVTEVSVRAGESVTAGQLLARVQDRASSAEYQRAAAELRRYEALLAKQAVTRAEYEAVLARYRFAEAALEHARVVAPVDGVVSQRLVDPGDLAAVGKPLFVIEQGGGWQLAANVPERLGSLIKEGDALTVQLDAEQEECTGRVAELIPAADPMTRSFEIKIDLACKGTLRSGAFGRAKLPLGERQAILVTAESVHQRGQLSFVFVDLDGRARMRLVRTGRSSGDDVEILSGLEPGDRVITSADGEVVDGRPLAVSR